MKQNPSKLKYKKNHSVSSSFFFLKDQKNFYLRRGFLALKTKMAGKLTYAQIEACRKSIRRNLKKQGKILLRTFTSISVTKKALASRMGKGKGNHSFWISPVRRGQIICEIEGVNLYKGIKALRKAGNKLPLKVSIVNNIY